MKSFRINILILLATGLASVSAQDIITLRNGDEIKVKVTEISTSEIRYKQFEHLDGPTRVVPRADVFAINYENGTREVINPLSKTNETQTASQTQTRNEMSRRQTNSNTCRGIALGLNYVNGFVFSRYSHVDFGFGIKLSYTFSVPIRLVGEFDVLWGRDKYSSTNTSWIDFDVYGQYLLSPGKGIVTYPVFGLGYANLRAKARFSYIGDVSSLNVFIVTLGWGLEGHFKNSKLFYSIEPRFKITEKNSNFLYRVHLAIGLGYKF